MAFKPNVWNQLKSLTKGEFISALERDGWQEEVTGGGSERLFLKATPDGTHRRIAIHFHHSKDTMGRGLLTALLQDTGWTDADLVRLKLIKR
jgi:predicted RNA binding protein YcfA (HicA-like mRNA interferase family)